MGEWNRTRSAIHDAQTPEDRDAAIDALWKMVRRETLDDVATIIYDKREFLEGVEARNTCTWILTEISHLRDD